MPIRTKKENEELRKKKKKVVDTERESRIQEGTAAIGAQERAVAKIAAGQVPTQAERTQASASLEGTSFRQVTQAEAQAAPPTKEETLAEVPIPRAEDISAQTSDIFGETLRDKGDNILPIGKEGQGRVPLLSAAVESNLGKAMTGVAFTQKLKEDEALAKQLLDLTNYMIANGLTPEQVSEDPFVQSALRLNLNENDLKVLKDGKAEVTKFAVTIEGLPVTSQLTKWTGGALTPTSAFKKIKDLDALVVKLTSKMDNWSEAISKNPQLADQYGDLIDDAEQEVINAQSRIKLLIIQSPILQNSPEEVENIQENLDRSLIKTTKLRSQVIQTKFTII